MQHCFSNEFQVISFHVNFYIQFGWFGQNFDLFHIAVHVNVSLRKLNGLSTFCTFREITTNKLMRVVGKLNYVVTAHPCVKHTCNKNVKFWFC